ncbi:putative cytokinetic ring protein SteA [Proteinivorax hydrogeniformans]|uniref:Cytokinetic ring protein SteA n=1 Tax=Proteinivorax hydrogeniformans TaxID=1826727 RepID=A0AAU8HQC6_9FIRM
MYIFAVLKKGKKTKDLIPELSAGDVALIDHKDIDEMAAIGLAEKKVRGVINVNKSISGFYPNKGPEILIKKGILLWDDAPRKLWDKLKYGQKIEVENNIIKEFNVNLQQPIDSEKLAKLLEGAERNFNNVLDAFIENTLDYAKKEKKLVTGNLSVPDIKTRIKGKPVVVVVRGKNYKEDLAAMENYIKEVKPVLIAVDGGADALLNHRLKPHIIVGDMDSVSDNGLKMADEVIAHGFPDGRVPASQRLQELGINYKTVFAPGTSEDIALLMAYQHQAEILIALGTHSNMIDFLEKGRKGMASTFLVRLKVGPKLIDAKGVSSLYSRPVKARSILGLIAALLLPFFVLILYSQTIQQILKLFLMRLRYTFF